MSKYRIHIDPPLPDRDQIARYQDFDSLYGRYQTHARFEFWRNLYRRPRNFALLVIIVAIGVLVFRSDQAADATASFRMHPPSDRLEIPQISRTISPAEAHDLRLTPALRVQIPAQAWQDSSGMVVKGPISLHHRVLEGAAEAFVAGVPRPDGQPVMSELHWVEIYATQQGRRLQLRTGYPLQVSWQRAEALTQPTVQRLDAGEQRWLSVETVVMDSLKPTALPRPERPAILDQVADTLPAKGAETPLPPSRPFGVSLSNPQDYPEFRPYQRVYWEAVPRPGTVDPWTSGLIEGENDWEEVSVRKQPVDGLYELRFSRVDAEGGIEIKRVAARPVFEAESEREAQRIWEQRQAAYQRGLAEHLRRDSLQRAWQERRAAARRAYETELAAWESAQLEPQAASWTVTYELPQTGLSGYWKGTKPEALRWEVAFPAAEPATQLLSSATLPWCYAVVGDRWLPLTITEKSIQLPVTETPPTLWWASDSLAYRWQVGSPGSAIERIPLDQVPTAAAWVAWLEGNSLESL